MEIWQRMVTSFRAAQTAWNGTGGDVARINDIWDTYAARRARYDHYDNHVNNVAYKGVTSLLRNLRNDIKMYKFIRGLIEFATREVDLCAAKCYGGTIDYENFRVGAIPLILSSDRLKEPIKQLFVTSNMGVEKSVLARTGALYGDVVGLIVDDPRKQHISIEFPHPSTFVDAEFDGRGNVKMAIFEYEQEEKQGSTVKKYIFKKVITEESFATFKDDKPFAFYENAQGVKVAEWDNPYPFVPVAVGHWKKMPGLVYGANSFYHTLGKLDEVNDGLSIMYDHLRRALNPRWAAIGSSKPNATPNTIDASVEKRDDEGFIYAPNPESSFQSLVHDVNIAGVIQAYEILKTEILDDLPELTMGKLRASGDLTAPGMRAGYSDAVDRLTDGNGNLDDFLVRITQMGITAGAMGRYDNFQGFNEQSYDNGDLAFTVKARDIIKDELTTAERIAALQASGAPPEAIWEELGVPEETIQEWTIAKQRAALLAAMTAQASQPPALGSGQPANQPQIPATTGGVRGEPLPDDAATAEQPVTPEQIARWDAMWKVLNA